MTEITRVPLLPIAKRSLSKLWIGALVALAAGGGLAWATSLTHVKLDEGVQVVTLHKGTGGSPAATDIALVNYRGTLPDGTVFDSGQQKPFQVDGVIPGFSLALQKMQKQGRYLVHIPSKMGYGIAGTQGIPGNTDLDFEVELLEFRTRAEVMQMMQQQQMMQQMQQMQGQGRGGAPGAGAPPPQGGMPPE
jgi:FKBP-type peptidyl-prolyl cis-trans isomerase FkpA